MSRVDYREVRERFTHIDARFVACEIGFPEKECFYTVQFYPWWEHPSYIKARNAGETWGFTKSSLEGFRPVTVYPQHLRQAHLTNDTSNTDWNFTQNHPLLWQYESAAEIICNAPLSLESWMQIAESALKTLSGHCRHADLGKYNVLGNVHRFGSSRSFSLGHFPRPLFLAIRQAMEEQTIPYFALREPLPPSDLPVLFLIDGVDYLIADDFELEVPEFIHKLEWFRT